MALEHIMSEQLSESNSKNSSWDSGSFNRRVSTFSHSAVLLTVFILAMIHLESVLKPFFIALGIYFVLKPGAEWLSKGNKFPILLSYFTMLMLFMLVILSAAFLAWDQAQGLVEDEDRQTEWNSKLNQKWKNLKDVPIIGSALKEAVSDGSGTVGGDLADLGVGSGGELTEVVVTMVSGIGGMITTSITVLFFLIFIIFEASLLPGRIERAWPGGTSERVKSISKQIQESVNMYIIVKTGCGLGSAFIAGMVMWAFGIDLWFVWAIMTFVMNYVPYIGSLIATIPPLVIGLILLKPIALIVMALLLLANQQVWGNYIETKWAGRALDLSPVVLLLVTAFSFWLWGVLGMILAVPLFVIVKIVLENIEETRPLAILLSERAPTLDEAWEDAFRDGYLSPSESHKLKQLQSLLGVSDEIVALVAGRSAISTILRRGKATQEEVDFILQSSIGTSFEKELSEGLAVGKINPEMKKFLNEFSEHLQILEEE